MKGRQREDAAEAFASAAQRSLRGEFDEAAIAAIRGLILLSEVSTLDRLRAVLADAEQR